jgi:2,4-dienoyl-CoA reductase-like NADH-dependent reductase (Old Yellow Enzyme family)
LSCSDWAEGGWDIEEAVVFCMQLRELGVDLIDCSSGGAVPQGTHGPVVKLDQPGYQVHFAEQIRREAGIPTAAVGLITGAQQAEEIIAQGRAEVVMLGRELLRNPYWPQRAAAELGAEPCWPKQYGWAV